jgi:hypothetical protein
MSNPLSIDYWEALRRLAEPLELMKFTLIYDGDLPASANKPKPIPASRIRNEFHHQMADLWDSHIILRQLAATARFPRFTEWNETTGKEPPPIWDPDNIGSPLPLREGQIDLCAPIPVPNAGNFKPLVRRSLSLACAVDVLFLRHEEPYNLMRQGGDLDGRIKTLFDALKMPDPKNEYVGDEPTADPLYVAMEDDSLISDVSIRTGRLLGNRAKDKHAVRLVVDITIKVLRVYWQNQCLIGG